MSGAITREFDRQRALLQRMVEYAEAPDQCRICDELLDKPDNDNGDGEWLGHRHDCPVADAKELLERSSPKSSVNDTIPRHSCDMERWPKDGYGEAVDGCHETEAGEFWVGNGEYGTRVNYCPACGAKAPTQVVPPPTCVTDGCDSVARQDHSTCWDHRSPKAEAP